MTTNEIPETEFIINTIDLHARVQSIYNETRQMAQDEKWSDHIKRAALLIPYLHYLGWKDWIARILGRIAWSYIRENNNTKATSLLEFAENYDLMQSTANYYWAGEYAHRQGNHAYAQQCLNSFREIATTKIITDHNSKNYSDLELAVQFYEQLVIHENEKVFFSKEGNQSDFGRCYELKARLEQNPRLFRQAAEHYKNAGLKTYATCCLSFAEMTQALSLNDYNAKKKCFEKAYKLIEESKIFADIKIRQILIFFLCIRIEVCKIFINLQNDHDTAAEQIEESYREINKVLFGPNDEKGWLSALASQITTLGQTPEWSEFISHIDTCPMIVPTNSPVAEALDETLNRVQKRLPSYSFLVT